MGIYVRSKWEANYARYLNWLKAQGEIVAWEYEPMEFEFPIKKGTRFYKPDFKVISTSGYEWHEVKGWHYPKGETAMKRFRKYYPEERLIVIDSEWFSAVRRQGIPRLIAGWE